MITVIRKNQSCWPHILSRIEEKFKTESKSKVLQKLQPFALFVLYDYDQKLDQVLQLELLKLYKQHLDVISKQKIIVLNKIHNARSLRYCKVLLPEVPQMISYVILSIHESLQNDEDAAEAIWILHQHLRNSSSRDYSLEIVMLADCLPIAPITSMDTLCECINLMFATQQYPTLVTNVLKSCLLIWKMHFATTPILSEKVSGKIDEVLSRQFEHNDIEPSTFEYLDEKPYIYSHILANEYNMDFLDALSDASPQILEMQFTFLLALLNDDNESEFTLKVLKLCLKACTIQVRYTTRMLPVLLQKVSNSVQPDLHLECLRAVAKMGVLKENISTIVMAIKSISVVSTQMHAFAISLMFDLVLTDKICFPYLEELLVKDPEERNDELIVTKAFVTRELCRLMCTKNLENHRKELASIVSKTLMRTIENNLVIKFSFEALKYLCVGFDPYTTMLNIVQRFENTDSDGVIAGMCGIMGEVASMPDITDQKCEEIVKRLFSYTETHPSQMVLEAVYTNLSNFGIEQLAIGFPTVYTHITNDNSILGSLAGACWVNLLQFGPKAGLRSAANMLIKFIDVELKSYKRSNYAVADGQGEPIHMSLTRDNVLAAVAKFVRKNVSKLHTVDRDVYIECLRILNTKYVCPLPPMDWTFLAELKDNKDMLEYVLTIAARQSSVSGSARRFMENYIKLLTDRNVINEAVMYVYKNLDILCNTIQPVIMKPFFKKTIKLGCLLMEHSHKEIDFILEKLEMILKSPKSSDSNKAAIAEVVIACFDVAELESDVSEKILPVVGAVPRPYLNDYSPVQFETVNDSIMFRCLSVHCVSAVSEERRPFSMLDPVIDCRILKSCVQPAFKFEIICSRLTPVFIKHHAHPGLPAWLSELTNKINIELAERKDMRNVIFASTVFIIAVVVSSGFHIFVANATSLEEFSAVFPFGLGRLLRTAHFAQHVAPILESMYDFTMNPNYKRNVLSEQIARRFKHGLLVMRSHEVFNEKFCWMKYIEINL